MTDVIDFINKIRSNEIELIYSRTNKISLQCLYFKYIDFSNKTIIKSMFKKQLNRLIQSIPKKAQYNGADVLCYTKLQLVPQ